MLYRMKFDSVIGDVLTQAGYTTTSQKMDVWAPGLTATYVENAKRTGIEYPQLAAYIAIALFYSTDGVPHHHSVDKAKIANALVAVILADDSIEKTALLADLMPQISKMRRG